VQLEVVHTRAQVAQWKRAVACHHPLQNSGHPPSNQLNLDYNSGTFR